MFAVARQDIVVGTIIRLLSNWLQYVMCVNTNDTYNVQIHAKYANTYTYKGKSISVHVFEFNISAILNAIFRFKFKYSKTVSVHRKYNRTRKMAMRSMHLD